MRAKERISGWRWLVEHSSVLLLGVVLVIFGGMSPRFLEARNLMNILVQASSPAIVATGMTLVLLTAGVDLSVGAILFLTAAVAGKLVAAGVGLPWVVMAMLGVGLGVGGINALLVTRVRITAFMATLGVLFLGRGLALWLTQTRAMNLPRDSMPALTSGTWVGVPVPVWIMGLVMLGAQGVLTWTPYGRQLYAVGQSAEAARKAGLRTRRLMGSVYWISGGLAAVGAMITLGQLGAVSPKFGETREFTAIAAAVLGGTSLFGGRGRVLPGTLTGAVLMQTLENGLVILNADPYLYPLVTSGVIFVAVLIDATRHRWQAAEARRRVEVEDAT